MNPVELHSDFVKNRFESILQEAACQRELPSLRQRLATRVRRLTSWLEPDTNPAEPARKRAAS